jgi:ribosome maturation factor RimP
MIDKNTIEELVNEYLAGGELFPVYINVGSDNNIKIVIDGDNGVTIDDCVNVSRYVEHKLDRDKEDFELNVMSAGIDYPFLSLRQYRKNINRSVKVILTNEKEIRGKLLNADKNGIILQEEIVKAHKKNKKIILGETLQIPMNEIKQTKVIAIF